MRKSLAEVVGWVALTMVAVWVSAGLTDAGGIDWRRVPVWYESPSAGFTVLKLTNTADALYVYIESSVPWTAHTVVFFDTDASRETGFHGGWMAHGYDVMCDAWNVYAYAGQGYEWSWTNLGAYTYRAKGNLRELCIPRGWVEKAGMVYVLGRTSPPETFTPRAETDVKPYDWVGSAAGPGAAPGRGDRASTPQTPRAPIKNSSSDGAHKPAAQRTRRHEVLRRLALARDWRVCPTVVHDGALLLSNGTAYVVGVMRRRLELRVCQRMLGGGDAVRAIRSAKGTFRVRTRAGTRTYWGRYLLAPVRYDVFFTPTADRVSVAMLARAGTGCVIQAGWALGPLKDGDVWHEDVRTCTVIRRGEVYANTRATGVGMTGRHSRYPWAVVSTADGACGMFVDVNEPVFHELYGTSEEVGVRFDAALSEGTLHAKLCAAWEGAVCALPAQNAWRVAIARYYALYPRFARLHGERRDGLWLPFTSPARVVGAADYGFAVHEYIDADPQESAALGVAPFFYHEPTLAWWPMHRDEPRTVEYFVEQLKMKGRANDRLAQAILADGERDRTGAVVAAFTRMPWNDGARVRMFPLPTTREECAEGSYAGYLWSRCAQEVQRDGVRGLYVDSMNANAGFSYAREHLARLPFPAVTALGEREPAVHGTMALYVWCEHVAEQLRPRGLQLMGNYPFALVPFLAQFIDVPGEETTWYDGGEYRPMPLAELDYLRAMSGEKSYLFLQCCDFEGFGPYVERYVARCGAYGFFPSMFSHNSADQPYWETPRWYERDRAVFARYVPVIAAMARAGWRPVGNVQCKAAVVCEEFGAPGDGRGWWISLYNPDTEIVAGYVQLSVTGAWLALQPLTESVMPIDAHGRLGFALAAEAWLPSLLVPAQVKCIEAAGATMPVVSGLVERTCAYVREVMGHVPSPLAIVESGQMALLTNVEVRTSKGPLKLGTTAVCPPALVTVPVSTQVSYRAAVEVPVKLRKYASQPIEVVWRSLGGSGTAVVETALACVTQVSYGVMNCSTGMLVEIEARSGAWRWLGSVVVRQLPRGGNLLQASDVTVSVDSYFPGYTAAPLRDGVTAVEGVPWSEAAWASSECGGAHWIDIRLPEARRVRAVRIYWHKEGGAVYTARALEVWGAVDQGDLECIWRGHPERGAETTEIVLPTKSFRRLKLVQPDGMGATERPHLMWVREVEVEDGEDM